MIFQFALFTVALQILSIAIGAPVEPNIQKILQNNPNIKYLGAVNGKYFFYENSEQRSFLDAIDFARENSINLAALTTKEEQEFINSLPESSFPTGGYWTSGMDTDPITLFNFRWLTDGDDLAENHQVFGMQKSANYLVLQVTSNGKSLPFKPYYTLEDGVLLQMGKGSNSQQLQIVEEFVKPAGQNKKILVQIYSA